MPRLACSGRRRRNRASASPRRERPRNGRCISPGLHCRGQSRSLLSGGWMASIFLSYARTDARKAVRVANALEAAGHSVWWDKQLNPGERFSAEIDRALKSADAIVALWSKASIESAWVQDEAGVGRDSGRL